MAIPEVTTTISDGSLGLAPEATDLDTLTVGTSSAGTVNTLYGFGTLDDIRATLGSGPLPEALALKLSEVGHGTVYGMRVTGSVVGTNGAVTRNGTGPSPGMTLSGTPLDFYEGIVLVVVGGAIGTFTFKYSLDGGDSYSPEIVSAATYVVSGTGLTFNFAAGTYVAADTYTWTSTAPYYATGDLTTAITAALADSREWGLLHCVGAPTSAANTATLFSVVDTAMANAEAAFRFTRAVIEAADDTDANLISAFAALASVGGRTAVVAGYAEVVSPITGRIHKRSAAWPIMARAGATPISQDLAWVGRGPLNAVKSIIRDERKTPGLDTARFMTLRTIIGAQGFYVTNPRTMASSVSDFRFLQHGRVIDRLARTVRIAMLPRLNESVRVNGAGTIYEIDARNYENDVQSQANAAIVAPGHGSSVAVLVNRTDNIITTQTLRVSARCVPLAYNKAIAVTLGFTNPALTLAATA